MTKYRDRSAVPDWALLALMATAVACSREQARVRHDDRPVPITSTTPGEASASQTGPALEGAKTEVPPS
jgi:hypothetical protein